METLKLQTNVPEVIALKFATGLEVASKFGGDQVMFTLTDDRRAYLPPIVAQRIADAGVVAGECFEICKRETVTGNRRSVDYQIRTDLQVKTPAVQAPALKQETSGCSQHNAAVSAAARQAAAPSIVDAGKTAIDAVLAVEEYARARGMTDFSFGAENIQKVWLTLFIGSLKGGR